MIFPAVAAGYAALLALVFAALSAWVMAGRFRFGALHGDGGSAPLGVRIRAHANFIEYVPLILILALLYEASGGAPGLVHVLLAPLLVARIAHPFGMTAPANSLRQYGCRGLSAVATLLILVVAAVLLALRVM
ncbi:MAPEG family protein [Methylocella sp.]|uniref:MAPEG family protein n=1 Tax=Methylocella sp. TaxID=1978226 RepID=UPI00378370B1